MPLIVHTLHDLHCGHGHPKPGDEDVFVACPENHKITVSYSTEADRGTVWFDDRDIRLTGDLLRMLHRAIGKVIEHADG